MTSWYQDKLYPLQDKVLGLVAEVIGNFPLYLTGGTCLSRVYYQHRYSDDLDFFYHDSHTGKPVVQKIIKSLDKVYKIERLLQADEIVSIKLEGILKLDIVRDVGEHWGELLNHKIYPFVDNRKNILANKVGAIMDRDEAKDVVDFWKISKEEKIDWPELFSGAATKAAGILPPLVAKRLDEFPLAWLDKIQWIGPAPDKIEVKADLDRIIEAMLKG